MPVSVLQPAEPPSTMTLRPAKPRPLSIINEVGIHVSLRERGLKMERGLRLNSTRPATPSQPDVFSEEDEEEEEAADVGLDGEPLSTVSEDEAVLSLGDELACASIGTNQTTEASPPAPPTTTTVATPVLTATTPSTETTAALTPTPPTPDPWHYHVHPSSDIPGSPYPLEHRPDSDSREAGTVFTSAKLTLLLKYFDTDDEHPDWVLHELERHMRAMDRFDSPGVWSRGRYLADMLGLGRETLAYLEKARGAVGAEHEAWLAKRTAEWRAWVAAGEEELVKHWSRHARLVQPVRQLRNEVIVALVLEGKRVRFRAKLDVIMGKRPVRRPGPRARLVTA